MSSLEGSDDVSSFQPGTPTVNNKTKSIKSQFDEASNAMRNADMKKNTLKIVPVFLKSASLFFLTIAIISGSAAFVSAKYNSEHRNGESNYDKLKLSCSADKELFHGKKTEYAARVKHYFNETYWNEVAKGSIENMLDELAKKWKCPDHGPWYAYEGTSLTLSFISLFIAAPILVVSVIHTMRDAPFFKKVDTGVHCLLAVLVLLATVFIFASVAPFMGVREFNLDVISSSCRGNDIHKLPKGHEICHHLSEGTDRIRKQVMSDFMATGKFLSGTLLLLTTIFYAICAVCVNVKY